MPDDKPGKAGTGKAPIIIFGSMFAMSLVTVAIVFWKHAQREQPYLQSKLRRVVHVKQPRANTLSLNYAAFGPQAKAYEIIGNQWWQWQESAGDTPAKDFDIKVIIYRGATSEELLEQFPVIEEKRIDSRYLKFETAMEYLDRHIAENESSALTLTLTRTREQLVEHFEP